MLFSNSFLKSLVSLSSKLFVSAFIFSSVSISQAQGTAAAGNQPPGWIQFVPILFMVVVFYFLVMRPQAKKAKEHQGFLQNLKRGDAVITDFGVLAEIKSISDKFITLEISDGVEIRVLKHRIAGSQATLEKQK